MSTTNFIDGQTPIAAEWLNEVDEHVFDQVSGLHDSSHIAFTANGTGAVASNVSAKLKEIVSVKDFGALGDGTGDDLAAINLAIDALNAGSITALFFPAGIYRITSKLTAITASGWKIYGDNAKFQLITGVDSANGTVFTIGTSTSGYVDNWYIDGFTFIKNNHDSLTSSSGNPIEVFQGSDGVVSNCSCTNTLGFITLGNASASATTSRIRCLNIEISTRGDKGGKVINIVRSTGHRFHNIRVTNNTSYLPVSADYRGIYCKPTTVVTIDSGIFSACEFNYPAQGVTTVLEIDASVGSIITNQFFTNCIFDHATVNGIKINIDSGAPTTARINNIIFTSCRAVHEDSGGPIKITNGTGSSVEIFNISFNGGFYHTYDQPAVDITTDYVYARFNDVSFSDVENITAKPIIRSATGTLTVTNCVAMRHNVFTTPAFTYGVQFTAAVNGFNISGNNFSRCTLGDVDTSLLNNSNAEKRVISSNTTPVPMMPFRGTTTDATATIIASHILPTGGTYYIEATVIGVKDDGSARATYKLAATYYRDGAGNVTQQGTTTTLHSAESDASWAAEFVNSTTAAQIRVTGVAATTIKWGCSLSVFAVPE